MMKRKFLGLAVTIGALAVIVSALALSSATVTNNLNVSITNTNASLIAITGTGVDSDVTFSSTNGYAEISIPATTGMQPGSTYTFYPAFNVVNNTAAPKTITLLTAGTPATGVTMTFVDSLGNAIVSGPLAAAGSLPVGIKFVLTTSAVVGATPLTMTVGAN
jgi:hypothetical protein